MDVGRGRSVGCLNVRWDGPEDRGLVGEMCVGISDIILLVRIQSARGVVRR